MERETTTEEVNFTPIQRKMLAILSDGEPHTKKELHQCCHPESRISIVRRHIGIMRKKLEKQGEWVVCEYSNGSYYYRHVKLLK